MGAYIITNAMVGFLTPIEIYVIIIPENPFLIIKAPIVTLTRALFVSLIDPSKRYRVLTIKAPILTLWAAVFACLGPLELTPPAAEGWTAGQPESNRRRIHLGVSVFRPYFAGSLL